MNHIKTITTALAILLVTATLVTKAQDATTPGNISSPTVSKFNDIVEVNIGFLSVGGFTNVFAYKPSNNFSIGGGIGFGYFGEGEEAVLLSGDFRYYFNPGKYAAPFLNLYGGYAFASRMYGDDNIFVGANFGINIMVGHHTSLQMALGLEEEGYRNYHITDLRYLSSGLTLPFTIGLSF